MEKKILQYYVDEMKRKEKIFFTLFSGCFFLEIILQVSFNEAGLGYFPEPHYSRLFLFVISQLFLYRLNILSDFIP